MDRQLTELSPIKSPTDSWCSLAWNYYYVGPDGDFRPCCRFNLNEVPTDLSINSQHPISHHFKGPFLNDMRDKMLKGDRIQGCKKCYDEEKAGESSSYRQISNRQEHLNHDIDFKKPKIRFLELSYSNKCNIQCRTCTPYFSSAWRNQWAQLQSEGVVGTDRQCIEESSLPGTKSIDMTLLDPHLTDLRQIKFTGGEPLLVPQNHELLEKLISMGLSKNIQLNYSTNLTIAPSSHLISLWKQFKHIEIAASLDGIGPILEYVRYPSRWEKVNSNVIEFMKLSHQMSLDCGLRSAISIYNILSLPETIEWWIKQVNQYFIRSFNENSWLNPSQISRPTYLAIKALPQHHKELVLRRFENRFSEPYLQKFLDQLCSVMLSEDHSHLLPQFRSYTNRLDQIRGEDFTKICPEFSDLVR